MVLSDIIGFIANSIYVLGSGSKKILWLRISLVIGASLEIWYYIMISPSDLWQSIFWDAVLILTNLVMITIFVYEKGMLSFTHDEAALYFSTFSMIDKSHFKKLTKVGVWLDIEAGNEIITEGEPTDQLLTIYHGQLEVTVDGKIVAILHGGSFVGEMSFLTGGNATASVTTLVNSRFFAWEKQALIKILETDHELDLALKKVFSADLINKLVSKNK